MAEPSRIYLDANVFIYALEGEPEVAAPAQLLLSHLKKFPGVAATSELTLAEVLVKPERLGRYQLKRDYLNLILASRVVELRPVSRAILTESARYRACVHSDKPDPSESKRNFLPDAIHVVTAIEIGAHVFVARDTRIRLPQTIRRVSPESADIRTLIEGLW